MHSWPRPMGSLTSYPRLPADHAHGGVSYIVAAPPQSPEIVSSILGDLEEQELPLGEQGGVALDDCATTTADSEGVSPPPGPILAEDEWAPMGENQWPTLRESA